MAKNVMKKKAMAKNVMKKKAAVVKWKKVMKYRSPPLVCSDAKKQTPSYRKALARFAKSGIFAHCLVLKATFSGWQYEPCDRYPHLRHGA